MSQKNNYPKIAIDGPAGTGKSTVTREVSRRLRLKYLDTGAMYRAITLKLLREKVDLSDDQALEDILQRTVIKLNDKQEVFLNGEDVTEEIRGAAVNKMVSPVAAISRVRRRLVEMQRAIAAESGGIVMEGRDIASKVMPDADFKFYLDATLAERARRRWKEQNDKGIILSGEEVMAEIKNRDSIDSKRDDSPLTSVFDAIVIDTTSMDFEAVVDKIVDTISADLP